MKIIPGKCFTYDIVDDDGNILASGFGNYQWATNWIDEQKAAARV